MSAADPRLEAGVAALVQRYGLPPDSLGKVAVLVDRLANDPHAPTSVRDPIAILDRHLADSLVALELEPVRQAQHALDLGSGAGLPGLPLAAALPRASFVLLESAARKSAFLKRTADACEISNVQIVQDRAESYVDGRDHHDLVTVRAVASLEVNLEYAAPLLKLGGTVVLWVGRRAPEREAAAGRAAEELGLAPVEVRRVEPFPQARDRHLYVTSKVKETPTGFPRRPGTAVKRPLGAISGAESDRTPR